MIKLKFIWLIITHVVTPQEKCEGKQMYNITFKDGTIIEYAYKEEVLEYIETGTFEYNEDITLK
jgi:hypothetical protein